GWTVMSVGIMGISPLIWTTVITRVFERQRGLALSVALSGTGISTLITPMVSATALQVLGWRAPFLIFAGGAIVIGIPLLAWLMSLRPDFGIREQVIARPTEPERPPRLGKILREIRVWQVLLASFLTAAAVGMIATHFQAIMRDAGASTTQAAFYFTLMGP